MYICESCLHYSIVSVNSIFDWNISSFESRARRTTCNDALLLWTLNSNDERFSANQSVLSFLVVTFMRDQQQRRPAQRTSSARRRRPHRRSAERVRSCRRACAHSPCVGSGGIRTQPLRTARRRAQPVLPMPLVAQRRSQAHARSHSTRSVTASVRQRIRVHAHMSRAVAANPGMYGAACALRSAVQLPAKR
jgi:hypothetical protein